MIAPNPAVILSALPSREKTFVFTNAIHEYLFPIEHVEAQQTLLSLRKLLLELLAPIDHRLNGNSIQLADSFFASLDGIRSMLLLDAQFFLESDPAAASLEEVIVTYPGFNAITSYRIAHVLYQLDIPILPRLITEYAHSKTGIDIHPGAQIAAPVFIDHGTGIVIGQTTVIGKNVKLYQGVTLGALAVLKEEAGKKRHPTIEDDVIIYAGSCILGGNTVVGRNSIIGGNVFLTESIPPFSFAYHKSEVKIRDKSELNSVIDFVI